MREPFIARSCRQIGVTEIQTPTDFNKVELSVLKSVPSKSAKIESFNFPFLNKVFRENSIRPSAGKIYLNWIDYGKRYQDIHFTCRNPPFKVKNMNVFRLVVKTIKNFRNNRVLEK